MKSVILIDNNGQLMRIGVISDIHGNKVALDEVLEDMDYVDKIICVGDIIGYGPRPQECVETVRNECEVYVQGNHDRDVARPERYMKGSGVYEGLMHARKELNKEQLEWVTELDRTAVFKGYKLVHSHPEVVDRYVYPRDFGDIFSYVENEKGILLGHTHYQHAKKRSDEIVMNPGSVGQPRDGDVRAGYGVLNSDDNSYELHRVSYNIKKTQEQIEEAGLPNKNGRRLGNGK